MKSLATASIVSILLTACAIGGHTCPRGGLETARNCRRDCVQSLGGREAPLPCECLPECGCWRFPGHPSAPADPDAEPFE